MNIISSEYIMNKSDLNIYIFQFNKKRKWDEASPNINSRKLDHNK